MDEFDYNVVADANDNFARIQRAEQRPTTATEILAWTLSRTYWNGVYAFSEGKDEASTNALLTRRADEYWQQWVKKASEIFAVLKQADEV